AAACGNCPKANNRRRWAPRSCPARPAGGPFGAGLAPDVGGMVLVRRRHPARAAVARAQPPGDALRGRVVRVDAMDGVVPAQVLERPVQPGARGLGGVAVAPGVAVEGPADLVARPAVRPPGP